MNNVDLFERAKARRLVASLALRRVGGAKVKKTPKQLQEALNAVTHIQSMFGAPKTSDGQWAGKAGRTVALIELWLKATGYPHGLPPVGGDFASFIRVQMDKANHLWGIDEAVEDTARDIHYNFHFDPREIVLEDEKEEAPVAEHANMVTMPKIVSQFTKPSVKSFTKQAEAYEPPKKDDFTKLEPVPVVTRVDYTEDIDKAKEKSQFPKQPLWNKRNTGINDLLVDLSSAEYEKKDSDTVKGDEALVHDKTKPYPKTEAAIKGFTKKKLEASQPNIILKNAEHFRDLLEMALTKARLRRSQALSFLESNSVDVHTVLERGFFSQLEQEEQGNLLTLAKVQLPIQVFERLLETYNTWAKLPLPEIKKIVDQTFEKYKAGLVAEWRQSLPSPTLSPILQHYNELAQQLDSMFNQNYFGGKVSLNGIKGFTKKAGLFATPVEMTSNCPDHPSVRLGRVVDREAVYCCPIDGKKYDFLNGFTKSNGEQVGGGSIAEQVPDFLGHMY